MKISEDKIRNTIKVSRKSKDGTETFKGFVVGVEAPGVKTLPFKELEAIQEEQVVERAAGSLVGYQAHKAGEIARKAWRAKRPDRLRAWENSLEYYVFDEDMQLVRDEPFTYPASALKEGLLVSRLYPDGTPDIVPGEGQDRVCQVVKGDNPREIATWWWTFNCTDYEPAITVKMFNKKDDGNVYLPRTEG